MAWVKIDIDEMSRIGARLQETALRSGEDQREDRIDSVLWVVSGDTPARCGRGKISIRAILRSLWTRDRELAVEDVLRALVVGLGRRSPEPHAVAIGAGRPWSRPGRVAPAAAQAREWVGERVAARPRSALLASRRWAQKNGEMTKNMVTNQMVKRLDGLQAVTKLPGFEVTRADAMKYQSNVSSMGYRGNSYNSPKFR